MDKSVLLGRNSLDCDYMQSKSRNHLTIGMWPQCFRKGASDDLSNFKCTNFPHDIYEDEQGLSLAAQAFLAKYKYPVMVGLGTSARNIGSEVYKNIAEVCVELRRPCVLIGADPLDIPVKEDWIFISSSEPFAKIFPYAGLVVHHGGIATMAAAFRAGVPSLIIPFMLDQFDNALRARDMGLARCLKLSSVSFAALRRILVSIGSDRALKHRAENYAKELNMQRNGAEMAADYIWNITLATQ